MGKPAGWKKWTPEQAKAYEESMRERTERLARYDKRAKHEAKADTLGCVARFELLSKYSAGERRCGSEFDKPSYVRKDHEDCVHYVECCGIACKLNLSLVCGGNCDKYVQIVKKATDPEFQLKYREDEREEGVKRKVRPNATLYGYRKGKQ